MNKISKYLSFRRRPSTTVPAPVRRPLLPAVLLLLRPVPPGGGEGEGLPAAALLQQELVVPG